MSLLPRLTRAAAAVAIGAALVGTSAAVASAAPAAGCSAHWQFDVTARTPHQTVYDQVKATGPAAVRIAPGTVTKSTVLPATLPAAAKNAVFATLDAKVSGAIRRSVSMKSQSVGVFTVPAHQTWYVADVLKHWAVTGHLYLVQATCHQTRSRNLSLQAFQPFAWSHQVGRPFSNF
jgi:hypothetical protein